MQTQTTTPHTLGLDTSWKEGTLPYQVDTALASGRGYRQELRTATIYLCARHSHWVTEATGSQPADQQIYPNRGPTACWACAELAATPHLVEANQLTN